MLSCSYRGKVNREWKGCGDELGNKVGRKTEVLRRVARGRLTQEGICWGGGEGVGCAEVWWGVLSGTWSVWI